VFLERSSGTFLTHAIVPFGIPVRFFLTGGRSGIAEVSPWHAFLSQQFIVVVKVDDKFHVGKFWIQLQKLGQEGEDRFNPFSMMIIPEYGYPTRRICRAVNYFEMGVPSFFTGIAFVASAQVQSFFNPAGL